MLICILTFCQYVACFMVSVQYVATLPAILKLLGVSPHTPTHTHVCTLNARIALDGTPNTDLVRRTSYYQLSQSLPRVCHEHIGKILAFKEGQP